MRRVAFVARRGLLLLSVLLLMMAVMAGTGVAVSQVDFYVYPNGYTNMTALSDELGGITSVDGETRMVLQYINTTDSQVYGTFVQGPSGSVPIPGSLSVPYQSLTDSDYIAACETDFGNAACLNISEFSGQNQSEIDVIYSAIVPHLNFWNGSDVWGYDYSQYWATDFGSVFNFSLTNWNVTSIVPVLHPYRIYRNGGKIALVSKALPSTPDIWFQDSLTDKHVRYQYNVNGSTFACYGDEDNLPGVFCDVPVSGSGKSVTVGSDRYISLVGSDFTDPTTEYFALFSLTATPGYGQSYFNGDDGTATINHAVLLGPSFYQSNVSATACDLTTQFPLVNGTCWYYSPPVPPVTPTQGIVDAGSGMAGMFSALSGPLPAFLFSFLVVLALVGVVSTMVYVVSKAGEKLRKG